MTEDEEKRAREIEFYRAAMAEKARIEALTEEEVIAELQAMAGKSAPPSQRSE